MDEIQKPSLLIVDDDPLITDTLSYALNKDFEVLVSDSRLHAISLLRQLDSAPQLALVDLGLPPTPHRPDEGFQLIADLLAHSPPMKILVLSGQNDAANARHARTLGAAEFVAKPCDPESLKKILLHALQFRAAEISGEGVADTDPLIGKSPALQKLKSQISQYADSPFPALIEGESGTGKELVAVLLHRLSWRRSKPWYRAQLRRHRADAGRADAVRLRQGRVHRGHAEQVRLFRGRGRRHPVSGRDRRAAAGAAGQAPAGARERRIPARGRDPAAVFARARHRGDQSRPSAGDPQRPVPPRPVSPAFGVHHQRAAAARHGRGQGAAARALSPVLRRAGEDAAVLAGRSGTEGLARLPFPGQRARAAQHRHTPDHEVRRPEALGRRDRARVRPGGAGRERDRTCPETPERWSSRRSGTCSASAISTWTTCSRPGSRATSRLP